MYLKREKSDDEFGGRIGWISTRQLVALTFGIIILLLVAINLPTIFLLLPTQSNGRRRFAKTSSNAGKMITNTEPA
jgi:hypothetical protein